MTPSSQPWRHGPTESSFARLVDRFVDPAVLTDPRDAARAQLVVASAFALALIDVMVLLVSDWGWSRDFGVPLPRPAITGVILSIPMNLSIPVLLRRTGSWARAGLFLITSLTLIVAYLATFGGGFRSPITWWLAAVPLFGAFLASFRGAVLSSTLVIAVLMGMYALEADGVGLRVVDAREVGPDAQLRAQLSLTAFLTFVSLYYDRVRRERDDALVTAYVELEDALGALRGSQANLSQIAEHIGQAIWLVDPEADAVLYANSGFEEIFGVSRAELAAEPRVWQHVVEPDDLGQLPTAADGRDHAYRIRVGKDEVRWIRHAVYPAYGEDEARRLIHIAANITLRREVEELRERFIETVIQAQEVERRHLARELHDGTSQSLAALLVGLKSLEGRLSDDASQALVAQLREQVRAAVGEIGRMSRGLHPAVLDAHGLIAAIERQLEETRSLFNLRGQLHLTGKDLAADLPKSIQLTIYRIAQEAITNVSRHAGASTLDVVLDIDDFGVHLRVEDDGRGFDPKAPGRTETSGSGLGLQSMRERASLLRGEVQIESAPGSGTTIIADLPLREPTEALLKLS